MRRTILLVMSVALVLATWQPAVAVQQPAASWKWASPQPMINGLNAISMLPPRTGWTVGQSGMILHTSDGANWTVQDSGTSVELMDVQAIDALRVWAVGEYGTILASGDGGATWSPRPSGTVTNLNSVTFVDAAHGWAVGMDGVIRATTDGGATWKPQTSPTINELHDVTFVDSMRGWIGGSGGVLLHTSDGGIHWTTQYPGREMIERSWAVEEIFATSFLEATAFGWGGSVLKTTDGGAHWSWSSVGVAIDVLAASFLGGEAWVVGEFGMVRHLTGGGTWEQQVAPTTLALHDVAFTSTSEGWAVGEEGTIIHTVNGGVEWVTQSTALIPGTVQDVSFATTSTGWAVGSGGEIVHTDDGGATWSAQSVPGSDALVGVFALDDQRVWAVAHNTVFRTDDGGTTWTPQESGIFEYGIDLVNVWFQDASEGWAIGSAYIGGGSQMLHTSDGGRTWEQRSLSTNAPLHSICFSSDSQGWAVGDFGYVLETTDAGDTWTARQLGIGRALRSVAFADANRGWIVGEHGTILHTTDGGATWSTESFSSLLDLYDVASYDGVHAWAAGELGLLMYTADAGANWVRQLPGVRDTQVHFKCITTTGLNELWLGGTRGVLLHTTNGGSLGGLGVEPIAGKDRYQTAVKICESRFESATTVVIATGQNWPDALGGASLAGAYDSPILLTQPNALPAVVEQEIARLGATSALIIGGEAAVSEGVASRLRDSLHLSVSRIAGGDRYTTGDAVAAATLQRLRDTGQTWDRTLFVATGANFPDALAATPLASAWSRPVLLVAPTRAAADASSRARSLGASEACVLGGSGAVSLPVERALRGTLSGGVVRVQGSTRYQTATAIAEYGAANGLEWDQVAIASGQNYPDALAGGVAQGHAGGLMLLTPSLSLDSAPANCLYGRKSMIKGVTYFGGTGAVSAPVRTAVSALLR